jgi:hypothetical protein
VRPVDGSEAVRSEDGDLDSVDHQNLSTAQQSGSSGGPRISDRKKKSVNYMNMVQGTSEFSKGLYDDINPRSSQQKKTVA